MEIEISIEKLRKRKIFVATPMYGGMCGFQYCKSRPTRMNIALTTYIY